jgi:hypothetical protein
MERSFAQATRYGFKRARWRRLWRVEIQEYLTAAIQNIKILVKDVKEPGAALQMRVAAKAVEQASRAKYCGLLNLTRWRAISLDFVALWRSFCLAILLRSSAERKSNQIQKNKKYSLKFVLSKYRFRQQPVKV